MTQGQGHEQQGLRCNRKLVDSLSVCEFSELVLGTKCRQKLMQLSLDRDDETVGRRKNVRIS